MCEVGARCASSARADLEKVMEKVSAHETTIQEAKKSGMPRQELKALHVQTAELKEEVSRAQLALNGTKSGLKNLTSQGYSIGDPVFDRARMKNAFNRAVYDRKKRTGSATVSFKEVLSPV